jgi:hypothetical protein
MIFTVFAILLFFVLGTPMIFVFTILFFYDPYEKRNKLEDEKECAHRIECYSQLNEDNYVGEIKDSD